MGKGFIAPVMVPVKSSNVKAIGYDDLNKMLYVEFLNKKDPQQPGDFYRYYEVDERMYLRFLAAPSKGKFLWWNIRGRYRYTKEGRTGWRGPKRERIKKSKTAAQKTSMKRQKPRVGTRKQRASGAKRKKR